MHCYKAKNSILYLLLCPCTCAFVVACLLKETCSSSNLQFEHKPAITPGVIMKSITYFSQMEIAGILKLGSVIQIGCCSRCFSFKQRCLLINPTNSEAVNYNLKGRLLFSSVPLSC